MNHQVPEVILILGSARKSGDTEHCSRAMLKTLPYDTLDLLDYNIHPYRYDGLYPDNDQLKQVIAIMARYKVVIFATPVYWYAMSGIMKTFFDRFTDLITREKPAGYTLKGLNVFVIAVGAEDRIPAGFEVPFRRTAEYLGMLFQRSLYLKRGSQQINAESSGQEEFLNAVFTTMKINESGKP